MISSKVFCKKVKDVVLFVLYPSILFMVTYFLPYMVAMALSGILSSNNLCLFLFYIIFLPISIILYLVLPLVLTITVLKKWGKYLNKYFDNMVYPILMLVVVFFLITVYEKVDSGNNFLMEEILHNIMPSSHINILRNTVLPHFIAIFIYSLARIFIRKLNKIK